MAEFAFRVAKEFDVVKVRVPDDVQRHVDALVADCRCTSCEKKLAAKEKVTLGQCQTCYQGSRMAILRGKYTNAQLIREGKRLPPAKGGRKPKNKFTKELSER